MKIEIQERKKNPLLKREEIIGVIEHDGNPTPSKAVVQKILASQEKVDPKYVEVEKILTGEGERIARVSARIWEEREFPVLLEEAMKKEKEEETGEGKSQEEKEETKEGETSGEGRKEETPKEAEKEAPEKKEGNEDGN